jgi:hypothetical protein
MGGNETIGNGDAVLGERYADVVTGFEGIDTAHHEYMQGCRRVTLERADKDGKPEASTFDEPNLVHVDAGVRHKMVLPPVGARTGGPHDGELDAHDDHLRG